MADQLLDNPESSYALKTALRLAVYLNPILLVLHLTFDALAMRTVTLTLMSVVAFAITVLIAVSGQYFRRNLGKYLGGVFVGRVGTSYARCSSTSWLSASATSPDSYTT